MSISAVFQEVAVQHEPTRTRPFARFGWMLAWRYLRARRSGGFVSVIAALSFLGIALGVATLIVVMSVMNGFHKELLDKIVGINGHLFVQAAEPPFSDYKDVVRRMSAVPGVTLAIPMLEGAAGVSSPSTRQERCSAASTRPISTGCPALPPISAPGRSTASIPELGSRSANAWPRI